MFIPSIYWSRPSAPTLLFKELKSFLNSEFRAILGGVRAPGLTLIPIALIVFILFNNALGLFPFVFTSSRHLTFTVSLALPLWLGHILIGCARTPNAILAHLVPLGTPPALMPFMVLIEIVRRIIRPLTLAVRLAANIVAGHLLLTLLGNQAPNANLIVMAAVLSSLFLLATLETAVAIIQAYVFRVLSTLYFNEVNSPALA